MKREIKMRKMRGVAGEIFQGESVLFLTNSSWPSWEQRFSAVNLSRRGGDVVFRLFLLVLLLIVLSGCGGRQTSAVREEHSLGSAVVANEVYSGKGGVSEAVVATGKAQILESGEQVAYERAKEHALRNAVEAVLGTYLLSQTQVVDSRLIRDDVLAESSGYVEQYEVLSEKNEGTVKTLSLRAWVVLSDVEADVTAYRLLQRRAGLPRLVIVPGSFSNQTRTLAELDERVWGRLRAKTSEKFLEKQFRLVNDGGTTGTDGGLATVGQDWTSVGEAGRQEFAQSTGAEVMIELVLHGAVNDTSKNALLRDRSLKSVTADVNLRAYNGLSGAVMAAASTTQAGIGLSEEAAYGDAGEKGLARIIESFVESLLDVWDQEINEGRFFEIVISGISVEEGLGIKERLSDRYIEGLVASFDRGYQGRVQRFTVQYIGEVAELTQFLIDPGRLPVPLAVESYNSTQASLRKQ